MKVLVLTGSPKGTKSVTLQYLRLLESQLPGWEHEVHHVAHRIKALERDPAKLEAIVERVAEADLVLWAFPLYYLLVPSQYKRFIELLEERGHTAAFAGKPTATLSTSIKFHDHHPHRWLQALVEDWDMVHLGWWSAHMHDLFQEEERARVLTWGAELLRLAAAPPPAHRLHSPLPAGGLVYEPGPASLPVDLGGKRALVLHDAEPHEANLQRMAERVANRLGAQLVNLRQVDIKAGCQGCCRCGLANQCIFEGKDGYTTFFREQVQTADVIVFAGTVRSRHLSSVWRSFLDRSFFMGHAPSLLHKQVAFLVSGPLSHLPELRDPYESWVQIQHSSLVGWVSDEATDSPTLDHLLDSLAERLAAQSEAGLIQSWDFRAEGGRLVFRDEIWLHLRFVFQADHRRYKELGYYDFPQGKWRERLERDAMFLLTAVPPMRKVFREQLPDKMVEPFAKVVEGLPAA